MCVCCVIEWLLVRVDLNSIAYLLGGVLRKEHSRMGSLEIKVFVELINNPVPKFHRFFPRGGC